MDVNLNLVSDSNNTYVGRLHLNLSKSENSIIKITLAEPERIISVKSSELLAAVKLLQES